MDWPSAQSLPILWLLPTLGFLFLLFEKLLPSFSIKCWTSCPSSYDSGPQPQLYRGGLVP
jgi:hypothetical protein